MDCCSLITRLNGKADAEWYPIPDHPPRFFLPWIKMRRLHRPRQMKHSFAEWSNKLEGIPAFILGNGCSANDVDISLLSDYLTIGINRAYKLIDPTILIWQDPALYNEDQATVKSLEALKYCRDVADPKRQFYNYHLKPGAYHFDRRTAILRGSGSTGPLAVELACGLGCSSVVLIGMDCKVGPAGTDFYGDNPHHNKVTLPACLLGLEAILRDCPVPVLSCSTNDLWPRTTLPDAIQMVDPNRIHALGRTSFVSRILS